MREGRFTSLSHADNTDSVSSERNFFWWTFARSHSLSRVATRSGGYVSLKLDKESSWFKRICAGWRVCCLQQTAQRGRRERLSRRPVIAAGQQRHRSSTSWLSSRKTFRSITTSEAIQMQQTRRVSRSSRPRREHRR